MKKVSYIEKYGIYHKQNSIFSIELSAILNWKTHLLMFVITLFAKFTN
jgi:hypothetical protein